MRSIRHEIFSVATVLAMPVAIAWVFPYSAIGYRSNATIARPAASSAFVSLTEEEEFEAIRAARSTWSTDRNRDQYARVYLPLGDLPEAENGLTIRDIPFDRQAVELPDLKFSPGGWLPSQHAAAPVKLPALTPVEKRATFSREQLLNLKP